MGVGLVMTGAVSFVVKIFTEASASVASMVVTALINPGFSPPQDLSSSAIGFE